MDFSALNLVYVPSVYLLTLSLWCDPCFLMVAMGASFVSFFRCTVVGIETTRLVLIWELLSFCETKLSCWNLFSKTFGLCVEVWDTNSFALA